MQWWLAFRVTPLLAPKAGAEEEKMEACCILVPKRILGKASLSLSRDRGGN